RGSPRTAGRAGRHRQGGHAVPAGLLPPAHRGREPARERAAGAAQRRARRADRRRAGARRGRRRPGVNRAAAGAAAPDQDPAGTEASDQPAAKAASGAPTVVLLGDVMTDLVARLAGPLVPASDSPARISVEGGGAAANTASWLAGLGARSVLLGRVGDDAAGRAAANGLRAHDGARRRRERGADG